MSVFQNLSPCTVKLFAAFTMQWKAAGEVPKYLSVWIIAGIRKMPLLSAIVQDQLWKALRRRFLICRKMWTGIWHIMHIISRFQIHSSGQVQMHPCLPVMRTPPRLSLCVIFRHLQIMWKTDLVPIQGSFFRNRDFLPLMEDRQIRRQQLHWPIIRLPAIQWLMHLL